MSRSLVHCANSIKILYLMYPVQKLLENVLENEWKRHCLWEMSQKIGNEKEIFLNFARTKKSHIYINIVRNKQKESIHFPMLCIETLPAKWCQGNNFENFVI